MKSLVSQDWLVLVVQKLVEGLFGYKPADSGEIYIKGEKVVTLINPLDAMKHKIGFVTEDRKLTGLCS